MSPKTPQLPQLPKLSPEEVRLASVLESRHREYRFGGGSATTSSPPKRSRRSEVGARGGRRVYARRTLEVPAWFRIEDYATPPDNDRWGIILDRLAVYRREGGYLAWLQDRLLTGPLYTRFNRIKAPVGAHRPGDQPIPRHISPKKSVSTPNGVLEQGQTWDPALESDWDQPLLAVPMADLLSGAFKSLPLDGRSPLLVDRHGFPEAVLVEHFKAWIEQTRLPGSLPGQRTGREPDARLNAAFVPQHFRSWHTQRIVPYFELTLWANRHGTRFPNYQLASLLFEDANEDRITYTRQKFERALADRHVLGNQERAAQRAEYPEEIGRDLF